MAAVSRGSLLRDINRMSTDIMTLTERAKVATSRLDEESATKTDLIDKIAKAEAEHTSVEKQKAAESANDSELVALQRAVASLTVRRQDLIKQTKSARAERDAAREEATILHYQRSGLQLETALAQHSSGSVPSVSLQVSPAIWTEQSLALLAEAESLWKKASNQSTITRDLLELALRHAEMRIELPVPSSQGQESSEESPSGSVRSLPVLASRGESGTGAHLLGLALPTLLADARKGLAAVHDLREAVQTVRERCSAAAREAALQGALSDSEEDGEGTAAEGGKGHRAKGKAEKGRSEEGKTAAVQAVKGILDVVLTNAKHQGALLTSVEEFLANKVASAAEAAATPEQA